MLGELALLEALVFYRGLLNFLAQETSRFICDNVVGLPNKQQSNTIDGAIKQCRGNNTTLTKLNERRYERGGD